MIYTKIKERVKNISMFFQFIRFWKLNEIKYSMSDKMKLVRGFTKMIENDQSNGINFLDTHVPLKRCELSNFEGKQILNVDVGGSFLKLCKSTIINGELEAEEIIKHQIFNKPEYKDLDVFEWIAKKIFDFIGNKEMDMTLTFSHPVEHLSLSSGKVLSFNKNFPFKKYENVDPVARLNEELAKLEINSRVKILLNDTTSTAFSGYFESNEFTIGIVLGTGTNGAYTDFVKNRIINTEWAAIDENLVKLSKYDKKIKKNVLQANQKYNVLDCVCGGYKFLELINMILKDVYREEKKLEYDEFLRIDKIPKSTKIKNSYDKNVKEIIFYLRKRTCAILSSLIYSIILTENPGKLQIYLNGTLFEVDDNLELLELELNSILKYDCDEKVIIDFVVAESASLTGGAYVLLSNY